MVMLDGCSGRPAGTGHYLRKYVCLHIKNLWRFGKGYIMKYGTLLLWLASAAAFMAGPAVSEDLPTANSVARQMGVGWNIGNSLEVPNDPLAWGNPLPAKQLVDLVKNSGFSTIRIPCAWDSHADQSTGIINAEWLTQVKTIIDYCINDTLFVVLNSHWDGGWLEESISTSKQVEVNKKQKNYWTQIATCFKNYDHHLLFAGANEPAVQDPYGTVFGPERIAVLNSYLQTFIDAVRATGGNNATRTLIIQGPRGDIELAKSDWTTLPKDNVSGRLMTELHFYPYQWALMESDAEWGKVFYYWGKANLSTTDTERNTTWCDEAYVDSVFNILKRLYVDKGMPVLLGEWGAMKRTNLSGDILNRHLQSRLYYYQYVVSAARSRGIIPAVWDAGGMDNNTFTVFNRKATTVFDRDLVNAVMEGAKTPFPGTVSVKPRTAAVPPEPLSFSMKNSVVSTRWFAPSPGTALVTMKNIQGRTIWSGRVAVCTGVNTIRIPAKHSAVVVVRIEQGGAAADGKFCLLPVR